MIDVLSWILSVAGLCLVAAAAAIVASYWRLAIAALRSAPEPLPPDGTVPANRFVILIPAHNEETCITAAVRSCQAQTYPEQLYDIVVIADNCTDTTARVVRQLGVQCLERVDADRKGKGFALEYALSRLPRESFDCVVILDADCEMNPGALSAFDCRLQEGERVLQASYVASNIEESAISYALGVGNTMENRLFWEGKEALRRFVMLRGTGMAIHRDILCRMPWRSFSVVEDAEFSLDLATCEVRVSFVPGVAVRSQFPATRRELSVQRERWSGGTSGLVRHRIVSLGWAGVRGGDRLVLDAALTCLQLSRPLVVAIVLLGAILSAVGMTLGAPSVGGVGLGLAALTTAGLGGYLLVGVVSTGLSNRRARLLLKVPCVLAALIKIAVQSSLHQRTLAWVRTPRVK